MFLVSSWSCLCPIHWARLSREWRFSWSSSDRWYSNYIWLINNFLVQGATYIRGLRVYFYTAPVVEPNLKFKWPSSAKSWPIYCSPTHPFQVLYQLIMIIVLVNSILCHIMASRCGCVIILYLYHIYEMSQENDYSFIYGRSRFPLPNTHK